MIAEGLLVFEDSRRSSVTSAAAFRKLLQSAMAQAPRGRGGSLSGEKERARGLFVYVSFYLPFYLLCPLSPAQVLTVSINIRLSSHTTGCVHLMFDT